jgi:hypothetical protein
MATSFVPGQAANTVTGNEQDNLISIPSKDKEGSSILHILHKAQPTYSGHPANVKE